MSAPRAEVAEVASGIFIFIWQWLHLPAASFGSGFHLAAASFGSGKCARTVDDVEHDVGWCRSSFNSGQ
eukprot:SAG31_NODE_5319_length_2613_cov_1.815036_1_plen_69_part_00